MTARYAGPQLCISTRLAATYLGVAPEVPHRWRKRGIGPGYVRFPYADTDRGAWHGKRHGMVRYPVTELERWIERCSVAAGRLPRPVRGRLPGG